VFHRSFKSMVKLYNWFCNYYQKTEKYTMEVSKKVLMELEQKNIKFINQTVLEYACGTGSLTFQLGKYFKSVVGKDASAGMLEKAKNRKVVNENIRFQKGNILNIDEENKSYDWMFVSFGIHLFSPDEEKRIIKKMLDVVRIGVVIIDHSKIWKLSFAFVELLEGSFYNQYLKMDFKEIAMENKIKQYIENNSNDYFYCVMIK
jgi:ubiquinone/menaquinone biosynthesis C-methylase UbiE